MIVGLSGYARSGKDTVADRLVTSHGFVKLAFADPLRDAVSALDPLVTEVRDGVVVGVARYSEAVAEFGYEGAKDRYPEIRRLLQRMGTEVGRTLWGERFWVDQVRRRIQEASGPFTDTHFVLPDCRFESEASFVQSCMTADGYGQVWRIMRPGVGPANDHPSEVGLDDFNFDRYLVNDKTVAALHEHVDFLVEDLRLDG